MKMSPERLRLRAKLARSSQLGSTLDTEAIRTEYKVVCAEECLHKLVDSDPPPTAEQMRRLAEILTSATRR